MLTKVFLLLCVLVAVMAYPHPEADALNPYEQAVGAESVPDESVRVRRQVKVEGGGGGSLKQPGNIGVNVDASVPVWKSDNGRHQIGVSGGYTGPLRGGSNTDKRIGAGYTFSFGK